VSADAIQRAADRCSLVINPVIYAEVSVRYSRIEDLDIALPKAMFDREPVPYDAALLAGKAFFAYRRRGGTKKLTVSGLFHRGSRVCGGVFVDDARCCPLSDLFSQTFAHRPGRSPGIWVTYGLNMGRPTVADGA
jgi:hypothetical protein